MTEQLLELMLSGCLTDISVENELEAPFGASAR